MLGGGGSILDNKKFSWRLALTIEHLMYTTTFIKTVNLSVLY